MATIIIVASITVAVLCAMAFRCAYEEDKEFQDVNRRLKALEELEKLEED